MKRVLYLGLLLSVCVVAGGVNSAFAQRQIPTGEQIAKSAKSAKLNPAASITADKNGIKATVTPVDLSKIKSPKNLEKGQVIAVVDITGVPDLPDGKYNVFVVKLNDGWQELFESGGKILKQTKIEVTSSQPGARTMGFKAGIELGGSCFCVSICTSQRSYICMMCPRCE